MSLQGWLNKNEMRLSVNPLKAIYKVYRANGGEMANNPEYLAVPGQLLQDVAGAQSIIRSWKKSKILRETKQGRYAIHERDFFALQEWLLNNLLDSVNEKSPMKPPIITKAKPRGLITDDSFRSDQNPELSVVVNGQKAVYYVVGSAWQGFDAKLLSYVAQAALLICLFGSMGLAFWYGTLTDNPLASLFARVIFPILIALVYPLVLARWTWNKYRSWEFSGQFYSFDVGFADLMVNTYLLLGGGAISILGVGWLGVEIIGSVWAIYTKLLALIGLLLLAGIVLGFLAWLKTRYLAKHLVLVGRNDLVLAELPPNNHSTKAVSSHDKG